ncbi:hypothetical protein MTYP_00647 [Methylophilaceae bacterium]|nr:hypothetical protein MTYP_00647 [Methylophilaceae bacterium]
MTFNLLAALPIILPKAVAWAEEQSALIAQNGQPLDVSLVGIAQRVGVSRPDQIRILEVPQLPLPGDPELRQAALSTGLLGPGMVGLTLGYSIYICHGHGTVRLLSHEFRHVYQYESAGSIASFLPVYLGQIATVGYQRAPLEVDARAHEIHHA